MEITELKKKLEEFLYENGAGDVGFCNLDGNNDFDMKSGVSFVIPLSDAIVDSINDAPTHTYFHHYRTVNAHIDSVSLKAGFILEKCGYKYVPVPASQSVGGTVGMFSHKYSAALSGLGYIGKSGLFISNKFGPRVRLGTILTNAEFNIENAKPECLCGDCRECVKNCPAHAITGELWKPDDDRSVIIDAKACSDHMKKAFQHIGRGAVCGICMQVCPKGKK